MASSQSPASAVPPSAFNTLPSPILSATGLRMSYPSGDRRIAVLEGVDCSLRAGTSLSIRGESGCGKTTLLNLLAGLETPDQGEIRWAGQPIAGLDRSTLAHRRGMFIGLVFQSFYLIPELNAADNVLMPARILGNIGAADRARALELLARVGLADRAHHVPAHLSGGERQRVAVARALMNRPRVVLADEPTGNLDEATGEGVMSVLLEVCAEQQASLVVVTHNSVHASRTTEAAFLSRQHLRRDR